MVTRVNAQDARGVVQVFTPMLLVAVSQAHATDAKAPDAYAPGVEKRVHQTTLTWACAQIVRSQ